MIIRLGREYRYLNGEYNEFHNKIVTVEDYGENMDYTVEYEGDTFDVYADELFPLDYIATSAKNKPER